MARKKGRNWERGVMEFKDQCVPAATWLHSTWTATQYKWWSNRKTCRARGAVSYGSHGRRRSYLRGRRLPERQHQEQRHAGKQEQNNLLLLENKMRGKAESDEWFDSLNKHLHKAWHGPKSVLNALHRSTPSAFSNPWSSLDSNPSSDKEMEFKKRLGHLWETSLLDVSKEQNRPSHPVSLAPESTFLITTPASFCGR